MGNLAIPEGRTRLAFVLPSFAGGGAERHAIRLLGALNQSKYELCVFAFRPSGPLLRDVPTGVPVHALAPQWAWRSSTASALFSVSRLTRAYQKHRPHLVFASMEAGSFAALKAVAGAQRPRIVCCVQNAIEVPRRLPHRWVKAAFYRSLTSLYERSSRVICVSKGVGEEFCRRYPLCAAKVAVIPNIGLSPLTIKTSSDELFPFQSSPNVVACGRLTQQKGFDILIRSFSAVVAEHPTARLWIFGEGPERRRLERLVLEHGLSSHVSLPGFVERPQRLLRRADAFVLSSRWEGMPLVLLEAMAEGVPVVATRCRWGPEEVITSGVNGMLVTVDAVPELGATINLLLKNRTVARRLGEEARRSVRAFHADAIAARYEDLFDEVARAPHADPVLRGSNQ